MSKLPTNFALPITINLVLTISNLLAAWGGLFFHPLLLLPWLALYCTYILFAISLLIYMIVILQNIWFKILLFLVVAPIIIVAFSFWLVVFKLYKDMRKTTKTHLRFLPHNTLRTVYTPEPHTWDQPLPIWAIPPQQVWNHNYLQQFDPRYMHEHRTSSWIPVSSKARHTGGRQKRSFIPRDFLYSRPESISLSDKYNPEKQLAESTSLSERYGPKLQPSFSKAGKTSPETKSKTRELKQNLHTSNIEIEISQEAVKNGDVGQGSSQTFNHEALVSLELTKLKKEKL